MQDQIGGVSLPLAKQFAEASYESNPPSLVDGYELVHSDGTLKFYRKGNQIVVAVRGTYDAADVAADAALAVGKLRSSHRYTHDRDILKSFQQRFPPHIYTYTGVGHSLGGALIDTFIQDGLLTGATSLNPAIQPGLAQSDRHSRIYHQDDPLYKLGGRFVQGSTTMASEPRSLLDQALGMTLAGRLYQSLKAHQLSSFSPQ
jgi:hypothetical protein